MIRKVLATVVGSLSFAGVALAQTLPPVPEDPPDPEGLSEVVEETVDCVGFAVECTLNDPDCAGFLLYCLSGTPVGEQRQAFCAENEEAIVENGLGALCGWCAGIPNATEETESCGSGATAGCYCDDACVEFEDCCPDACAACGECPEP